MSLEYDVVVVGAGGSGLAAAVSAAEHGGRVLVLEKRPQPGGTTALAIGSYTAAGTDIQRRAGIEDDWQSHVEDAAKFAPPEIESRNNDAFRQFFLQEAAATLPWLARLGLTFVGPNPEPPNRVARMHNVVPAGRAYIAALQLAALRAGVDIQCDAAVSDLIMCGGQVIGVSARVEGVQQQFKAQRGIILAAGDYSNSPEQIATHKGDKFRNIEGINPHCAGDGHRLAQTAGASLVNMDVTYGPELRFIANASRTRLPWLPTNGPLARGLGWLAPRIPRFVMKAFLKRLLVSWQHPEEKLFRHGAVLLNRSGKRFVNENASPDREIAVAAQDRKEAYILLDGKLVRQFSAWPHFVSTAPDIAYAYISDYQRLRSDLTTTGYTLEDVALRAGLDPANAAKTVEDFNRYVSGEATDRFGRQGDMEPLSNDPWVLLGPLKAYFTTTEGGAAVNRQLQVLNQAGKVIPGLYAAGQNGIGGMILWGHGLHIAWAITSGRLAGEFAMTVAADSE